MAAACATLAPAALGKNSRTSALTSQMAQVSLASPLCGSTSSGFIARFAAPSAAPKQFTPAVGAVVAMAATAEQTGMGAGLPKYITINVGEIAEMFTPDEEVSLESLEAKRILNISGRDRELPLKLLGEGDISIPLKVKGAAMSESAREKLEKAGGSFEMVKLKKKWSRWATEDAA
eukprot:jgi/Mesvir1/29320/Mv01576-RA.1